MPWTFSHPAAVFPLRRLPGGKLLNLPALVVGSLSPDFFYSIMQYKLAATSHHLLGWFYTAFPLCLLIFLLVRLLSRPLSNLFPISFPPYKKQGIKDNAILVLSLYIGAVTHIVWDAFTHETGFFVEFFPLLQSRIFHFIADGQGIGIYKILQHLSSLFGLSYLVMKYWQYQKKLALAMQKDNQQKLYRLLGIGFISAFLTFPAALFLSWEVAGIDIKRLTFLELTLSVPVFLVILIFIAVWNSRFMSMRDRVNQR
ncbi:DUF4184 family protein [Xenorhabdus sp. 12]|uniref:DUF4184 family protein n=1 Tax=Xenorhabdus santafensis TaxID=2582833 RepID=A0ABU4SC92_9GAMM|nr:DUF4184 family protein [Xenorhabdus sp. 12]MDX7988405.1 DUF4184 family protein [Xenorhabdus sp. 12]